MEKYRSELIKRITDLPASTCPTVFHDFTIHGDRSKVEWNIDMLIDNGMPTQRLSELAVLMENIVDMLGLTGKVIKTY